MIQEDKQLLLKELCSRLPYGVKCHFKYGTSEDDIILKCIDGNVARFDYGWYGKFHVIIDHQYIKPYLRPMSSMTEEERKEYELLANHCIVTSIGFIHLEAAPLIDWLNAHHFDFRNLIGKGLAIDCTNLNIY